MHTRRWIAGLAVTVVTAGGVALGTSAAFADPPSPTPAPSSNHASAICTQRVPAALTRINTATARINGDASVKGSTAWLQAKADKARTAGYPALADLLTERVSHRPDRLTDLATMKTEVQHVQSTDCAT